MTTATPPQWNNALAIANEKRSARADLKRGVAAGKIKISGLVRVPPACLKTKRYGSKDVTLGHILSWQHGWGRTRAERHLRELGIKPSLTLFDLSDSRRSQLAEYLSRLGV